MKVLLVHLPAMRDLEDGDRTESLGLGYIAAVLRRDGHDAEILDANLGRLTLDEAVSSCLSRDFDCVGITAMHMYKDMLIPFVRAVRAARPSAVIAAGGYLPTLAAEGVLTACPELDFVIRGEGESAASEAFGRIARGEDWRDSPGVGYLDGDTPVLNPPAALIRDLDSLPFPARDALARADGVSHVSIAASRGCYHNCAFCSVNAFYALSGGHGPRFRSAANVVNEIESVVESTGRTSFKFVDDDFIGPGGKIDGHAGRIAQEILARGLKVSFAVECRADEVNEDILSLLVEAGLKGVFLGIESGVQRQLDTYNKRITVEQNKRAIELVRRFGLEMQPGFIPFDPYTTINEFLENMQFAREVDLWQGQAKPCPLRITLYPGVPLVDKVREDGLLRGSSLDLDYTFRDPSVRVVWKAFQNWDAAVRLAKRASRRVGLCR